MLMPLINRRTLVQQQSADSLVPQDHLLRLIDRYIDFDFIRCQTAHLYCHDNGRPALDPRTYFKMLFIGYLYGIRSERQLMKDIEVNVAYRWFLGFSLTESVPDHSTISQNRRTRFRDSDIEQTIFDNIVEQAIAKGLVGGHVFYTDSTHLKASANKRHRQIRMVTQTPVAYLSELTQSVEADRDLHGKKALPPAEHSAALKEETFSPVDPDAGLLRREGKPEGFFYLDHRTVDAVHAIITDSFVSPANMNDSTPYLSRLDRMRERFDFDINAVGLDAGYACMSIYHGLKERHIAACIAYVRPRSKRTDCYPASKFSYDHEQDRYVCPQHQILAYKTTDRRGYRSYAAPARTCSDCQQRTECTRQKTGPRQIARHVWGDDRDRGQVMRLSAAGKRIYARRKETVERSFADAKSLHGQRYARFRGLWKVKGQCLLASACQNMKKIALAAHETMNRRSGSGSPLLVTA